MQEGALHRVLGLTKKERGHSSFWERKKSNGDDGGGSGTSKEGVFRSIPEGECVLEMFRLVRILSSGSEG